MQTASKKVINGWSMYDWANSAYNLVITSTIFPAYYDAITATKNAKGEVIDHTVNFLGWHVSSGSLYTYAIAFAYLVIAILSPILSSIADTRGDKKSFLKLFCFLGSISCCLLYFFTADRLVLGIVCCIIAAIGYCGSLVFYNAYLPEIAAPADQDKVSAKGFSLGYIGSVILQILCFVLIIKLPFGLNEGGASRLSFLLVGLWWIGFAQITFATLPQKKKQILTATKEKVSSGFTALKIVWQEIKQMPVLRNYLFSFFFYSMGVQTVMLAAALFGSQVIHVPTDKLILSILIIQVVAIIGAYLMAKLSSIFGNIRVLIFTVVIWIGICALAYYITSINGFYIVATLVGIVMGGIQSLSRSTYAKLMPETENTASFFSFYDVTEKIAIVIGMFSFGFIQELTGSMRNSIVALISFFFVGLVGLFITRKQQKKLGI
ncbi:MFS transporter [Rhizosphaericola mali]|uniref:MFS transporter n=1 Tax=Rhizosphaericola mali TaxID=2545455 RepID=A0A5P2G2D0_9BACT|nr:MFS transporter [Rhizosphaericola mali]QES89337.1 MFS transporter [Rhizosphaericola mali]